MIGDVEDGHCKVRLARTVRSIHDAILDDTIFNGKSIERIVTWFRQIPFYAISKSSIVRYGKFYSHGSIYFIFIDNEIVDAKQTHPKTTKTIIQLL